MKLYEYIATRIDDEEEFDICSDDLMSNFTVCIDNEMVFPTVQMWEKYHDMLSCDINVIKREDNVPLVHIIGCKDRDLDSFGPAMAGYISCTAFEALTGIDSAEVLKAVRGVIPDEFIREAKDSK